MLRTGSYVKQILSIQFFNRLSIWGHRLILVLLLIFADWYKHSNTNVAGCKCILNRFWCVIWRPKAIKMSTLYNGLHKKKWALFFSLFPLLLNLAYIDYTLCQIWSVYMQYLRCWDHSNKCLFLVIQQAGVLLNFLVSVYAAFYRGNFISESWIMIIHATTMFIILCPLLNVLWLYWWYFGLWFTTPSKNLLLKPELVHSFSKVWVHS